jgi:hypothetical protein
MNFKGNFPNKFEECHLYVAVHLFEIYLLYSFIFVFQKCFW